MPVKDEEEVIVETVGDGIVILLISSQVSVDDLGKVVGQWGGRLSEEGNDRLGKIL